jgi:hypothetical protein
MFEQMMKRCCGPDGSPDFDKMMHFMKQHDRTSKYDAIGWGLFFIWVGVAWITDVGWGIGLLGVAAITLGMQVARKISGEAVEGCCFGPLDPDPRAQAREQTPARMRNPAREEVPDLFLCPRRKIQEHIRYLKLPYSALACTQLLRLYSRLRLMRV